jgi:DNA-binding NtrC family response regulator
VVDDEPEICEILAMILRRKGYRVSIAHNGSEAMQQVLKDPFDVVFSDVRMPEMTGFELLREIRKLSIAQPKFLMMSGFLDIAEMDVDRTPPDGFISKPFDSAKLFGEIERVLKSDHKARQHPRFRVAGASHIEPNHAVAPNPASVQNISQGGMAIVGESRKVAVGDRVRVRVQITDPVIVSVFAEAAVRWIRPDANGGSSKIGLEFLGLEPDSERELQRLIAELGDHQS